MPEQLSFGGLHGRPLATKRFHVTLYHIGDYPVAPPQSIVALVYEIAATVMMPRFEVALDRVASFSGKAGHLPFVLRGSDGVAALMALQRILATAMMKAGLRGEAEARYTPHVTLLYDDRRVTEQAVETIGWTAREFVLVRSLLNRTCYDLLERWPLI